MQNEQKRIARVLQPMERRDMTSMSSIEKILFYLKKTVSILLSGIVSMSRGVMGCAKQLQGREYIPISPVGKVRR